MFKAFKIVSVITFCLLIFVLMFMVFGWVQNVCNAVGGDDQTFNMMLILFINIPTIGVGGALMFWAVYTSFYSNNNLDKIFPPKV